MPANFDVKKSTSLGFKVIQLLTKQLGGKLNFYNHNGSSLRFRLVVGKHEPYFPNFATTLTAMNKNLKTLTTILEARSDSNISFSEIRNLLLYLGFDERVNGGHHIYRKDEVFEMINLQKDGNKAKSYQVKQVRNIIIKYKLNI